MDYDSYTYAYPPISMTEIALPARWRFKAEKRPEDFLPQIRSEPVYYPPMDYSPPPPSTVPRDASPSSSGQPVASSAPRRSTRQPGLVKNPYIVREAVNLKAARNRVYALIEASEEAKRASALRQAEREAGLPGNATAVLTQRLMGGSNAVRSRSATPTIKKRKRGELEGDERYDHAYGYGEKDGEDIEMERELQKEYDEIVGKLWVEGPATTGAVISYMKARRKLLQVVSLVREWEAYKKLHNIPDAEPVPGLSNEGTAAPAQTRARVTAQSRSSTPIRRSTRPRAPAHRNAAVNEPAPKRRVPRKRAGEEPFSRKPSSLASELSLEVSSRRSLRRSASTVTTRSSGSPGSDGDAEEVEHVKSLVEDLGTDAFLHAPLPQIQNLKATARRATRQVRTADNSPHPGTTLLPMTEAGRSSQEDVDTAMDTQTIRASSQPLSGDMDNGSRTLRSRNKITLPTRFEGFVPTTIRS